MTLVTFIFLNLHQKYIMRLLVLLFSFSLFFIACKNKDNISIEKVPTSSSVNNIYDEVMKIHDEVMPKMSEVHRQKRKLTKLLKHADGKYIIKEEIEPTILFLEKADESMMTWMNEFDSNKKNLDTQASTEYFKSQKQEIEKISKLIKASIV